MKPYWLQILFFLCLLSLSLPAVAEEAGYTYYSSSTHFDYYTDDTWTMDDSYVEQIETSLEASYAAFVDRYGFDAPYNGGTITIYISADPMIVGTAYANGVIWLGTGFEGDDFYYIPAHELFHTIQYQYFTTADDYIMEGMAHWAEDVVDADYDDLNTYMNYPNYWIEDLWGNGGIRPFAIFWRYLSEQLATLRFTSLPAFGTQAIRKLLEEFRTIEETEGRYVDMGDMDTILPNLTGDTDMTMARFYKQFLVALYAKDLGNPFTNGASAPVSYPLTKDELLKHLPGDVVSPYDFVEDEEAGYPDLVLYSDGDLLSPDVSLSYTNTGVIYHSYYSTDGFQYYGDAEPIRIEIDSDVTAVEFEPSDIDDNIYYVMVVQYRGRRGGGKRIRVVDSLTDDASETVPIYSSDYPSDDFNAKYLIVFPFTMDDDPSDETGNNFEFTVTGL
ncbi:MAG: hypothetical protein HYU99_11435 [Deltaproteobacteria bacterium]|nr:hypothetical protein [Deltaproteobacteria bacterium]